MGKNDEEASASTENEHECKECVIKITEDLEFEHEIAQDLEEISPECCIYKVGKSLRKIKEEAYTPQFISIGPYHHRNAELADMEKQKSRYLKEFQRRMNTKMKLGELLSIIKKQEERIRGCYAESTSEFSSCEFIKIILRDAVFIMELFLRNNQIDKYFKKDTLLTKPWVYYGIKQDLMLLENQLPYNILEELYDSAFATAKEEDYPSFRYLTCNYFDEDIKEISVKIEHFTDLLRSTRIRGCPQTRGRTTGYLHNASKLHLAGVKFKEYSSSMSFLEVKFENKELQIPRFIADGDMECIIRNVMALEQFHYPSETSICSFIRLMGLLINTEKDVELLLEKRIIAHGRGYNGELANMFKKLCLEIQELESPYHEIITNLNEHYKSFWKRNFGNLKNVYFSDLWRGTGTIAAGLLLLLTLIQTVCSIIQVIQ